MAAEAASARQRRALRGQHRDSAKVLRASGLVPANMAYGHNDSKSPNRERVV